MFANSWHRVNHKKGYFIAYISLRPSGVSYLYETSSKVLFFSLGMTFALSIY